MQRFAALVLSSLEAVEAQPHLKHTCSILDAGLKYLYHIFEDCMIAFEAYLKQI